MMYKIVSNKLFIGLNDFFDDAVTRSARVRIKRRASVAITRVTSEFLTYRTLSNFTLPLGIYKDTTR